MVNPVMLLYIYDGDFWGYDFYGGYEEAHFSALPDYFGPVMQEEKVRLSGNPAALTGWFPSRISMRSSAAWFIGLTWMRRSWTGSSLPW